MSRGLSHAEIVEEQEWRDRIIEESIKTSNIELDVFLENNDFRAQKDFINSLKELQAVVRTYEIIRNRNNEIRREEYQGRFK